MIVNFYKLIRHYKLVTTKVKETGIEIIYRPGRYLSHKKLDDWRIEDNPEYAKRRCFTDEYTREFYIQNAWDFYKSTSDKNKVEFIIIFGKFHDVDYMTQCIDEKYMKGIDVCLWKILIRMSEIQLCNLFDLIGEKIILKDHEEIITNGRKIYKMLE